jgi:hypothetical protein
MTCLAAALAISAHAEPAPSEAVQGPIVTSAASPPVSTLAEVEKQPLYKDSWDQFLALRAKAHPPRPGDWPGVWENESPLAWIPGYPFNKARIPTSAPLKPNIRRAYDKLYDNFVAGNDYDLLSDCIPPGYPRFIVESTLEFAITPEKTYIISPLENEIHRVYTDGRGHIPDDEATPEWLGDAIGFWDGDTLIVHTTHVRGLPMSYERNGPPTSDELSGVEQWRMLDKDHIQLQITIYDPQMLTAPWRPPPRVYARIAPSFEFRDDHYTCVRGDVLRNSKGGTVLLLPGQPGYVDMDGILDNAKQSIDQLSR